MIKAFTISVMLGAMLVANSAQHAFSASTEWQDIGGGKARLIAVKNPMNDKISGAVEVKLDKGWKTYWKSPGGSGIAPEFDFSHSKGFYPEPVKFPAPDWIELKDASFFGYTETVSFPFRGEGEAITDLKLDLLIGVCEEICIPATASFQIDADALNTSDPELASKLAWPDVPSRIPANSVGVQLQKNESSITATWMNQTNKEFRAVLEIPGVWISDPVSADTSEKTRTRAKFNLPGNIEKTEIRDDWILTVISMERETGLVTNVLEVTNF